MLSFGYDGALFRVLVMFICLSDAVCVSVCRTGQPVT